jgi:hypothetical protein
MVVVVDVLIVQRKAVDPLLDQRPQLVLDQLRPATVDEPPGKTIQQPDRSVRRSQQQRPGVRADRTPSKLATTRRARLWSSIVFCGESIPRISQSSVQRSFNW